MKSEGFSMNIHKAQINFFIVNSDQNTNVNYLEMPNQYDFHCYFSILFHEPSIFHNLRFILKIIQIVNLIAVISFSQGK